MTEQVLVVITNYKRPANMPRIIKAWREQTVPCHIVVVDNSPPHMQRQSLVRETWEGPLVNVRDWKPGVTQSELESRITQYSGPAEDYPNPLFKDAHDVWRIGDNLGPACRFAPALLMPQYEYTIFADDDLIPGREAVQACLEVAEAKPDFATIGQPSRNFRTQTRARKLNETNWPEEKLTYVYGNVRQCLEPTLVDMTLRVHFTRTKYVIMALSLRDTLIQRFGQEAVELCRIHDDFLLCLGIRWESPGYGGQLRASYIIPLGEKERQLVAEDLDNGQDGGLWTRPGHLAERQRMLDLCLQVGWKSRR